MEYDHVSLRLYLCHFMDRKNDGNIFYPWGMEYQYSSTDP